MKYAILIALLINADSQDIREHDLQSITTLLDKCQTTIPQAQSGQVNDISRYTNIDNGRTVNINGGIYKFSTSERGYSVWLYDLSDAQPAQATKDKLLSVVSQCREYSFQLNPSNDTFVVSNIQKRQLYPDLLNTQLASLSMSEVYLSRDILGSCVHINGLRISNIIRESEGAAIKKISDRKYEVRGNTTGLARKYFDTFRTTLAVSQSGEYAYISRYHIESKNKMRMTVDVVVMESDIGPRIISRKGIGRVRSQAAGELNWSIDTEYKYGKEHARDLGNRYTLSDFGFPEPEFRQPEPAPPPKAEKFNLSGFVLVLSLPLVGILLILVGKWLLKAKSQPAGTK